MKDVMETVLINKDDIPLVAFEEMNNVHLHEVGMLNELHEKLQSMNSSDAEPVSLDSLIEQVRAHTVEHFSNEERLMQEYGFPAYSMHKMEHDRFLEVLQVELEHWKLEQNAARLLQFMNEYWKEWFFQHVSTMDTVTAAFVSNQVAARSVATN